MRTVQPQIHVNGLFLQEHGLLVTQRGRGHLRVTFSGNFSHSRNFPIPGNEKYPGNIASLLERGCASERTPGLITGRGRLLFLDTSWVTPYFILWYVNSVNRKRKYAPLSLLRWLPTPLSKKKPTNFLKKSITSFWTDDAQAPNFFHSVFKKKQERRTGIWQKRTSSNFFKAILHAYALEYDMIWQNFQLDAQNRRKKE